MDPRSSASSPRLSVIVITQTDLKPLERLLRALHNQTIRSHLELVIVSGRPCPDIHGNPLLSGYARVRTVPADRTHSTAHMRSLGVAAASAPLVAFTEDHCLPRPGWAEAFVRAHEEERRAVVGPAVSNGNPGSLLSWINFAIEYGEWLHPVRSGPAYHVPGHNSCYRKKVLQDYGNALDDWLEAESLLHWDFRARGMQVAMEADAQAVHYNVSRLGPTFSLRFDAGLHFAGMCAKRWSRSRRLLYVLGSPLIPFVRLTRIIRNYRKPGRPSHLLPKLLPFCLWFLGIETLGAVLGYLFGPGRSPERLAFIDFHRPDLMTPRDRKAFFSEEPS